MNALVRLRRVRWETPPDNAEPIRLLWAVRVGSIELRWYSSRSWDGHRRWKIKHLAADAPAPEETT